MYKVKKLFRIPGATPKIPKLFDLKVSNNIKNNWNLSTFKDGIYEKSENYYCLFNLTSL